ncbi:MAG: PDZ domain-containing protein [Phycisphaeraceae bacterium]|nr:PDZ domain-containing protein [Phycisphaeraceae bacterium]
MELWLKRIGALSASVGLCMVLAAGNAASAHGPEEEEEIKGDFSKPLGQNEDHGGNFSRSVMTTVDGGDTFTIENNNGKITVQKNGEKLSKSQYRVKGGSVEILDGDGNVVKTLPGSMNPGAAHKMRFMAPRAPEAPPTSDTARVIVRGAPKVMLGVTMSDADPEVLEQIGVNNGGVVLNSVSEGLPADKAGLKANDVVVEADGKPLGGYEALREALKTKSPGDELVLKIYRKGESQTVRVKLAKYDPEKMNSLIRITRSADESVDSEEIVEILKGVEEQVKVQVEALRSQLDSADWNKVRDQVSAALADAMKQLEEARKQAAEAGEMGAKWWQEHGQNIRIPQGWMQFTTPTPPPAPGQAMPRQDVGDKLDKLSEQLEKMNKRLDAMEKQIEKK